MTDTLHRLPDVETSPEEHGMRIAHRAVQPRTGRGHRRSPASGSQVDTCHGEVHRHIFDQDGVEIDPTKFYAEITEQGQDVVERFYEVAYGAMARDWLELARRWCRGS